MTRERCQSPKPRMDSSRRRPTLKYIEHDETAAAPERDYHATAFELDTSCLAPEVLPGTAPQLLYNESLPEVRRNTLAELKASIEKSIRQPTGRAVPKTMVWWIQIFVTVFTVIAVVIGVGVGISYVRRSNFSTIRPSTAIPSMSNSPTPPTHTHTSTPPAPPPISTPPAPMSSSTFPALPLGSTPPASSPESKLPASPSSSTLPPYSTLPAPLPSSTPPAPSPVYAPGECCFHLQEWQNCGGEFNDLFAMVKMYDNDKNDIGATQVNPDENTLGEPINDSDPYNFTSKLPYPLVIVGEHQNDYVQFYYKSLAWRSRTSSGPANCTNGGWHPVGGAICNADSGNSNAVNQIDCCFPC